MKKKIGVIINSIPLGVILILAEYYFHAISLYLYMSYIVLIPIITVFLMYESGDQSIYRLIFRSYIASFIFGMIIMLFIQSPPNYWLKPFNSFSIILLFPTLILCIQLIIIMFINIFKKE